MGEIVDNHAAGAGIAAFELHRTLITLLLLHGVIPKQLTLEMLDISLQSLEQMNAGAEAGGIHVIRRATLTPM